MEGCGLMKESEVLRMLRKVSLPCGFGFWRRFIRCGIAPKEWTDAVRFESTVMKHLKSRKHHSKAFRKEAVELLLTGRTLRELAEELHVGVSTLQEWKQAYLAELDQIRHGVPS